MGAGYRHLKTAVRSKGLHCPRIRTWLHRLDAGFSTSLKALSSAHSGGGGSPSMSTISGPRTRTPGPSTAGPSGPGHMNWVPRPQDRPRAVGVHRGSGWQRRQRWARPSSGGGSQAAVNPAAPANSLPLFRRSPPACPRGPTRRPAEAAYVKLRAQWDDPTTRLPPAMGYYGLLRPIPRGGTGLGRA